MIPIRQSWLGVVTAVFAALLLGIVFILPTGENPLVVYGEWLRAGFGCAAANRCAFLTALQYATPLIFAGLSAVVAFRVGLMSIGQFGQLVVGAGATAWVANGVAVAPAWLHLLLALLVGVAAAAVWGVVPGVLRVYLGLNEVIVTLILNPLALAAVERVGWQRIPVGLQLLPLVAGTKVTGALGVAVTAVFLTTLFLWRTGPGLAWRTAGQAPTFAQYAGIHSRRAVVWGMAVSGALAGLGGGLEVVGVHYRFVANFSSFDLFDGIAVSLLGQLHPLGVLLSSVLVGGMRLGALNGLQLQTAVPRELGNAIIALTMLFVAAPQVLKGVMRGGNE